MPGFSRAPRFVLRLIQLPPRLLYSLGFGRPIGNIVLLLVTTGRKSGKRRVTPLQYEEIDGKIYVAAALGQKADWVRNILANPKVEVRVKSPRFQGVAEVIIDPKCIADFLELRLRLHPRMVGAMLRAEGIAMPPSRTQLEQYAARLALIAIKPEV